MKRMLSLVLCALMLVGLLPLMSLSAPDTSNLIFTVMDRVLMSVRVTPEYVESDKLSFFSGGSYYVWSGYFESLASINKVNHNVERQTVTVYNLNESLFFDYSNNITMDKQGNYYDLGAMWRGGLIFLPLTVVAQVFGLHYKHVPQSGSAIPAPILYITSDKQGDADGDNWGRYFSQRLAAIKSRYAADLEALEQLPEPIEPNTQQPEQPPKLVYLIVTGPLDAQLTPLMLQALEETLAGQEVKAAFFIPADRESILEGADLLRRLYAEGYPIGLLLPQGEGALAALEAGNALLRKVIFAKTRLVCLEGGTQSADLALLEALVAEGCRLWDANITTDLSGQTTAARVSTALRTALGRASGTAVVSLESHALTLEALPALLGYINTGNYSLLTITDWDSPVNQAQVLQ